MAPYPALRRPNGSSAPTLGATPIQYHSNAPKIGGSEAAFIVLVILLAIIVIAASAGIYFLLRYGEPSAADRTARRKYSIRRRGVQHPLPVGLPGSFSEKISNVFKGRRAASGWVPARDEEDEWDTTDEPLRERHHDAAAAYQQQRDEFPRVGFAPASRPATLTEPSDTVPLSRSASHVDADESSAADFGRNASPILRVPALSMPTPEPEEEWLNAGNESRPTLRDGGGRGTHPMGYFAPQPRRADSGHDIPLFAGSIPFR